MTRANSGAGLWGLGQYQYDAMGNMLTYTLGTKTGAFVHSGTTPLLSSVTESGSAGTVGYDAAGNETATGSSAFTYSPRNHLLNDGVYEKL